jgi:hypothetical protein
MYTYMGSMRRDIDELRSDVQNLQIGQGPARRRRRQDQEE